MSNLRVKGPIIGGVWNTTLKGDLDIDILFKSTRLMHMRRQEGFNVNSNMEHEYLLRRMSIIGAKVVQL